MEGKQNFDKNIASALSKIIEGSGRGVKLAAAFVKSESQKRTPVDTGNLKASHYVQIEETRNNVVAEIGLTAEYALFVHEDLEAFHPTGQAKFLEMAIKENTDKINKLIAKFI